MVGWHHWLDGHEFKQTPGVGDGQGSLVCCSPWVTKSQTQLSNWTEVYSNPCPSSRWCHPTISSSVVPFSSCPQSLPASGSFPMSQLLAWGGQSTGVSPSASVLPMNTQDWSPLGWTGWISLQSKGLSRVFSNTTVQKHQFFWHSAFFTVQLSHPYITNGKTIALTRWTFVSIVMSLIFNMLSRLYRLLEKNSQRSWHLSWVLKIKSYGNSKKRETGKMS